MSRELDQLVSYVGENAEGYFLKGNLKDLEELLEQLFSSQEPIDLDSQRKLFLLSMSCYPLFSYLLDRDLNTIPALLRYSLISKCFFDFGTVETPEEISDLVIELLEATDEYWYENDVVGYRIFNLRESVLRNPSLDLEILEEEFHNTGDVGNISAILSNPNCPEVFLHQIISADHPIIFEDNQNEELIEAAKEILESRR